MSSAERAAMNAPRQSSASSQLAAIMAAHDRDEDSPSPSNGRGGKLDQVKTEELTEVKQEPVDDADLSQDGAGNSGGKNIKNDYSSSDFKTEFKTEMGSDHDNKDSVGGSEVKMEVTVKQEPGEGSTDVKPNINDLPLVPLTSGVDGKSKKCSKFH